MPYRTLTLKPGIDVEQTPTLNSLGWTASQLVRFREGLPEKWGGWLHLNGVAMIGTGRGMHAWGDLSGTPYLAVGSEQRLQVFASGIMNDITPLRKTSNPAVNFSTTSGSATVTIVDAAHGATTGDWINIVVPVSVGGLVLLGFYLVTVLTANSYTITAASNATSNVANGGAVPSFAAAASANVTVTLNNHGYIAGNYFAVQVATSVGGTPIPVGTYTVVAPVTTNTFVIQPGPVYTGTASENSGNARLQYLVPTGYASATSLTGYGVGSYGSGGYGLTAGSLIAPLRQWFLDNWGQDLIGNYTGSPIYIWAPPTISPALTLDTTNYPSARQPPTAVNISFVSVAQQMLIALGCDPFGGTQDPNLVRWCDAGDRTNWQAASTNQAGSFRIPTGSKLVGGIAAGNFNFLWTDIDMWAMTYQGLPFVWSFQKIAVGVDLLAARAAGVYENLVFWPSSNGFLMYDGSAVRTIPCTVWDFFFNNLDRTQVDKVHCAVNSWFGEVTWFFPTGGADVDSYVTLHLREGMIWSYGTLARTAWVDDNVLGAPIGIDTAGLLQQHETGTDADGAPMMPSIQSGWMTLEEGTLYTFVERIIADFKLSGGSVLYQILVCDYPTETPITYGPYSWDGTTPPYSIVRARGRLFAIKIYSTALGVFWRLGGLRFLAAPAGRR